MIKDLFLKDVENDEEVIKKYWPETCPYSLEYKKFKTAEGLVIYLTPEKYDFNKGSYKNYTELSTPLELLNDIALKKPHYLLVYCTHNFLTQEESYKQQKIVQLANNITFCFNCLFSNHD